MSYTLSVGQQQIEPVTDFQYLGSMIASPVEDLKQRRGLAWAVFWKLETIWHSTTLSTNTKLRLFDSLSSCPLCHMDLKTGLWMLKWRVINSFATSAYRIMTGVKWLDINKVRNSVVLDSVSRNDLIHTFLSRQLRFLDTFYAQITHSMPYMNLHMARLGADDLALTTSSTSPTYRK